MAGLDMRGLADGFLSGFQVMGQYQHQQRQSEQAERRLGMQEQKFGLDMRTAEMKMDELKRNREKEGLKFALEKAVTLGYDSVTEDEFALLRNHPEIWAGLDPQADFAIQRAVDVFDPSTSIDANDPDSLQQANLLFGDLINTGNGGQKRIVGWVPAPNGEDVMLELEVTREDGSTYRAPMTEGRGTEEDALVKSVPMEALVNHIQGLRMVRNGVKAGGPEAQERASQMLQMLRGETPERWEQVQGPGGSLLQRNTVSGEMESVVGRAPQPRADYSNRATALERDIEYLVSTGLADDRDTAWNMLNKNGPGEYERTRHQLEDYRERLSELEDIKNGRDWQGMDEEAQNAVNLQIQQLRDQRDQISSRLYSSSQPTRGGQQQGGAPSAAVDYLRNNDTPEIREQFRAKYGYLPEGL